MLCSEGSKCFPFLKVQLYTEKKNDKASRPWLTYALRRGHPHTRGIFHSAKQLTGLPYHFYVGFIYPTRMLQLLPGGKKFCIMVSEETRNLPDVITDTMHKVPENYVQFTLRLRSE